MTPAKLIHRIAMGTMPILAGAWSCGCGTSMDFSNGFTEGTYKPQPPPPRLSAPSTVRAVQGYRVFAQVKATDALSLDADLSALPEGSDARFIAIAGPFEKEVVWTPTTNDSGRFRVEYIAVNTSGTSRAYTTIYVTNHLEDSPPRVSAPAEISATVETWFSIQASADDPDGDPIFEMTCHFDGLEGPHIDNPIFDIPYSSSIYRQFYFMSPDTFDVTFRATNFLTATATTRVMVTAPEASASRRIEAVELP